jgi:uncharacterized membrane protein YvbJ
MATWKCEMCGWENAEKWDKCAKCGYPKISTEKDREDWKQANADKLQEYYQSAAKQQALEADPVYWAKLQYQYAKAQYEKLNSISSSLTFIVIVIIIGIVIQILAAILRF